MKPNFLVPVLMVLAITTVLFLENERTDSIVTSISKVASNSKKRPAHVYLLAGQSNMVGFGSAEHMRLLLSEKNEKNKEFEHLLRQDRTGSEEQWAACERVTVILPSENQSSVISHHLTMGLGHNSSFFGPELGFGWTMANEYPDHEIVIVKAAWNAKSLAVDFRPPSAPNGTYVNYKNDPIPDFRYGECYRNMINLALTAMEDLDDILPDFKEETGYELKGMVWFQGWNDQNDDKAAEYASNLKHLIRDVRRDLNSPLLPVVVGETGQHTRKWRQRRRIEYVRQQQQNVTMINEFRNNTLFVPTSHLVHTNGTMPQYNAGFHFSGHADTMYRIGNAFAKGMKQLLE